MANRALTKKTAILGFGALGDPTRRAIFERLAASPLPVGKLSDGLPVTRSAVSQHLRVLKEAGLVSESSEGTRRIYRLDPSGLAAMRDWLDSHWAKALDAFSEFADADEEPTDEETPK
jgi:DNA-binding transcriptional ArsR family regulator